MDNSSDQIMARESTEIYRWMTPNDVSRVVDLHDDDAGFSHRRRWYYTPHVHG